MTIKPLKTYAPPAYPTIQEARQDARLLERLPRRWGRVHPIASLVGTGILIHIVGTGCRRKDADQGNAPNVQIAEPLARERNPAKPVAKVLPVTRVAPLLEDALANDGRGSFGCVASSAPVFLSENEAIDLIHTELRKTGLKFQDMVAVDGLPVPAHPPREEDGDEMDFLFDEETGQVMPRLKGLDEGTYTFDLGTKDKSVVVKFLGVKDFNAWSYGEDWSSVQRVNYPWLTSRMRGAFAMRDTGVPVVIGLFFDPTTFPSQEARQKINKLAVDRNASNEQRQREYEQIRKETKEVAKEKLRKQVQHFVEYLKQEGVVEGGGE
ncbi:MAG: hypothetical protein FWG50_10340 [Kiritimatiellaeota bacterium]|nr:hypothetical protein [Kiritimatiellota bacterium]